MGTDPWGEETQLNQVGTFVTIIPTILAAMIMAGYLPFEVSAGVLFAVVAVAGIVGGVMNLMGRGPVAVGAIVGLLIAVGGFGAVYFWIEGRESVRKFEVALAFVIGAVPGFLLQFVMKRMSAGNEA